MSFSRFRTILLLLLSGVAAATCGMAVASGTGGGIDVQVTVGTDLAPDACAATTSLDVLVGDKVNFCYRVTNNSATPLAYQSLDDSVDGAILSEENLVIAPGATVQYNRIRVVAGGQGGERTTTWTARDARPDYTPSPRAGAFIDIASRPTVMDLDPASNGSDPTGAGMTPVDVPFSFPFYGVMANQLCVGVDGVAQVGIDRCILFPVASAPVPAAGMGTAILPLWDDFAGKESFCDPDCVEIWGTVYADTLGTAPNRQFVVEWFDLRHEQGGANEDRATFELIIDEATGKLSFEYLDVEYTAYGNFYGAPDVCNDGVCAAIGLQQDDDWATSYSFSEASITSDSAIDWIPTTPTTYSAQASVTLDIGKPVAALPSSIAGSAAPGAQTSVTLTLANTGDRDLNWTLDQGAVQNLPWNAEETVPAYISRMLVADYPTMDNTLLGFDAADPATNAPIGPIHRIYEAGAFIDDDFSTLYQVAGWHEVGGTNIFTTEVLERVDTTTAEITRVGDTGVGPYEMIMGLAWDPTTSTLFAAITAQDGSGTTLASVDRYTGSITRLMPVTGIEFPMLLGLAIDSAGHMYSVDQNSNSLLQIDSHSGVATVVGPIGDEIAIMLTGALAFDRSRDVLYMTGATADILGGTYIVDLASGYAGLTGTIGTDQQLASALAIATAGGPCTGATPAAWLSFDPAQGVVAAGGEQSITVGLDASALAEGHYEATLCLHSDDPYRHTIPVQVAFDVGGDVDTIYANGFEAQ